MKTKLRETIFFILIFLLFYLSTKAEQFLNKKYQNINEDILIIGVGAVFSITVLIIFYLAQINKITDNYKAFTISPGAMCRGGAYMFQGDDPQAKMCRDMAKTPEGRCEIAQFNCPNGFVGMPKNTSEWEYTSNSDSNWNGVKCKGTNVDKAHYDHPTDCGCGTCSMWF